MRRGNWALMERKTIGPEACPLLDRLTVLMVPHLGSLKIHGFYPNADDRDVHDHPWWFLTLVLVGSYDDMKQCVRCSGSGRVDGARVQEGETEWWLMKECVICKGDGVVLRERMTPGTLRFRPARHAHRTRASSDGAVTLVLTGPSVRNWGFYLGSVWEDWRSYIAKHGDSMRCDEEYV